MKEALLSAAGRVIKGDENFLFRKAFYNSYMNKYQESGNSKENAEQERKRVTKKLPKICSRSDWKIQIVLILKT